MNTEKLEKLKKSLENKFIPDNMKDKIRAEIAKLEAEIKTDDSLTKSEIKEEIKEIEEKVEVALEVAEEKKEQIEEKKKAVKKTKSTVEKRKPVVSKVAKKKTLYTVAKEIRKDGESWEDAKERARKQLKSEKTETQKKVKSEADKIKAFVKRRKELKGIKANDLLRDSKRPALPIGKRRSKDGNVYYEYRENRTDRLAPYFKDKVYLEKGGASGLSLVEVQFADSKYNYSTNMSGNITKEDAEKYFVGKTFDVGTYPKENMQKAIGIKFYPAGTWDDKSYEKGGEITSKQKKALEWYRGLSINEMKEASRDALNEYEYKLLHSYSLSKNVSKKRWFELIEKVYDKNSNKYASGGRLKSALMRDRNNFNHFEKHEIAYSKNKPHRKGYGYEDGGNLNEPKELKGYFVHVLKSPYGSDRNVVPTNKKIILVTDGKKGDSFSVMSNEPHLKLVKRVLFGKEYIHAEPKNFEGTDLKWKMFGGNFVWSSDSRFRDEVSELPIPLHDRIEYADGGTIIGVAETPLAHEGLPQYSGLVGETGALSAGELFELGGSTGLPAGAEQHFVNYYLGEGASAGIFAKGGMIDYGKDGHIKAIRGIDGKILKEVTVNGVKYRRNPIYKTYNSLSSNEILHKSSYAKGGSIENQYEGKSPEEVWNMLSYSQKYHFLNDHSKEIESTPASIEKATKTAFKFLPIKIKNSFKKHISEGQYEKGGAFESKIGKKVSEINALIEKAIDKDGDPIPVVDSSGTWEEPMIYKPIIYKNGKLIIEYFEPYSGKTEKEIINKSNMEFDGYETLLNIAKMYRKALRQKGISYSNGGKVSFKEKSTAIAKKIVGKKVEPKYQKQYGKTYDKKEAQEVGNKITGSQKAKYDSKMSKGGTTKRGGVMILAKQIRKDGESWASAMKRASEQLKKK